VMVSATVQRSTPLRPQFRGYRFRVTHGYRALDPRPRASPRSTAFALWIADTRFSGSGCRQTTSATTSQRTDTPTSIRFSRIRTVAITPQPECAPLSPRFLQHGDLPFRRSDHEDREPRQSFRNRSCGATSTPQVTTPKATARSRRRLRATPRPNHRLRRWPLDDNAGLHGPNNPE
jgi:hypothetical protein